MTTTKTLTRDILDAAWWSDARQVWVLEIDRTEVATVPGEVIGGSEHPRYYAVEDLADDVEWI